MRHARPSRQFLDARDAEVTRRSILAAAELVEALARFAPTGPSHANGYGAEAYERAVELLAELNRDARPDDETALADYERFCALNELGADRVESFDAWAAVVGEYVAVNYSAAIAARFPGTDPTAD